MGLTRRNMITGTGIVAAGMTAALPLVSNFAEAQDGQKSPSDPKLKFIVCGGHPGDPEYGCGGTVAQLVKRGHEVVLLYLNDGAWPPTPATIRIAEAKRACEILGVRHVYAGQANGHSVVDEQHYDQYRKILDEEKPDAVITQWPLDNHRDHRACWALTYDVWRQTNKRFSLYYYEVSDGGDTLQFSPTHRVDITAVEAQKKTACYAHASQSPDSFYKLQDLVARFRGVEYGCERAEAFILQVQSPRDVLTSVFEADTSKGK